MGMVKVKSDRDFCEREDIKHSSDNTDPIESFKIFFPIFQIFILPSVGCQTRLFHAMFSWIMALLPALTDWILSENTEPLSPFWSSDSGKFNWNTIFIVSTSVTKCHNLWNAERTSKMKFAHKSHTKTLKIIFMWAWQVPDWIYGYWIPNQRYTRYKNLRHTTTNVRQWT